MKQEVFYRQKSTGEELYRIGSDTWVTAPSFIPEVKGGEDIIVLLENLRALGDNNPIFVPASRWPGFRKQPMFKEYEDRLESLVRDHPTIYWDPPELFRKSHPDTIVRFALQGNRSKRRQFNKALREDRIQDALDMLPPFHQAFVERRLTSLFSQVKDAEAPDDLEARFPLDGGKAVDAWRDDRVDKTGYEEYMADIVEDAARFPSSFVVPTVPALQKSSDKSMVRRVLGANRLVANWCRDFDQARFGYQLRSYFHIYADTNILESDTDVDDQILEALGKDLPTGRYAGVVLTLSRIPNAWERGYERRLERFVTNVASLAHEYDQPVITPRASWYGLYLTDSGVTAFGSMLNGNPEYPSGGGGIGEKKHRWGKVPVLEFAREVDVEELTEILKREGELPTAEDLPAVPPRFSPSSQDLEDRLGTPREFRIEFGKVQRLIHAEEARRMQEARTDGTTRPGKRYLERSEHPLLGS